MSALLWRLADRVYPETHCGFRAKRSAFDMIFSLGQLYVAFIDPTKAFNLVSCDGFYWIFTKIGCPHKLLRLMQSFRSDRSGEFWWGQFRGFQHVRWYETRMCASPNTLGIFFVVILKHTFDASMEGVFLHTRSDGKLFYLSWLRTKTKVHKTIIRDLLFANDVALASCPGQQLQKLVDKFSQASKDFGMTISIKKNNMLGRSINSPWGYWPNFLWSKEGFFSSGVGPACLALLNQKRESRPERGFESWFLQCQRSALPILSYQSNWKLGVMWVNNEIVDDGYRCRL